MFESKLSHTFLLAVSYTRVFISPSHCLNTSKLFPRFKYKNVVKQKLSVSFLLAITVIQGCFTAKLISTLSVGNLLGLESKSYLICWQLLFYKGVVKKNMSSLCEVSVSSHCYIVCLDISPKISVGSPCITNIVEFLFADVVMYTTIFESKEYFLVFCSCELWVLQV